MSTESLLAARAIADRAHPKNKRLSDALYKVLENLVLMTRAEAMNFHDAQQYRGAADLMRGRLVTKSLARRHLE